MNIIKINGTTAELKTDYGTLIRVISHDVKYAEINPLDSNMILITRTNGMVDITDDYGITQRNICDGANMERFNGNELAIYKVNGQVEIRDMYGILLRMV